MEESIGARTRTTDLTALRDGLLQRAHIGAPCALPMWVYDDLPQKALSEQAHKQLLARLVVRGRGVFWAWPVSYLIAQELFNARH